MAIDLVIDWVVFNPFDFFVEESAEKAPFAYDRQTREELKPYLVRADRPKALTNFSPMHLPNQRELLIS